MSPDLNRLSVPSSSRALAALATAVVAVGLAAGTLTVMAATSEPQVRDANQAFLEVDATNAVIQQTQQTVERAFSFGPRSIPAARKEATKSLVDEAVTQYADLYGPLFEQGRSTGLSITTTVRSVGVESLSDDRAELLVLADQTAASPDGQSTTGAAQLGVSAVRRDGTWKIARIELL